MRERHNILQADCSSPDVLVGEPYTGWRRWIVDGDRVVSAYRYMWQPGWNAAECHASGQTWGALAVALTRRGHLVEHEHVPPVPWCTCGIYAHHNRRDASHPLVPSEPRPVFGAIAVQGRVLLGERGLRAQFARIVELHGSTEHRHLGDVYAVPYIVTDDDEGR